MVFKRSILLFGIAVICTVSAFSEPDNVAYTTENQKDFIVYPNPVTDGYVILKTEADIKRIEIVSIVGQIIYTKELEPTSSVRLNLDQIQSGIYLMRVSYTNNTSNTQRIWVK
jgi:hypothetical protein